MYMYISCVIVEVHVHVYVAVSIGVVMVMKGIQTTEINLDLVCVCGREWCGQLPSAIMEKGGCYR